MNLHAFESHSTDTYSCSLTNFCVGYAVVRLVTHYLTIDSMVDISRAHSFPRQILQNSTGQFEKFCSSPWQNCSNFCGLPWLSICDYEFYSVHLVAEGWHCAHLC